METCYVCGEELDYDGECPTGCTEADDYYAGVELDDEEMDDFDDDFDDDET